MSLNTEDVADVPDSAPVVSPVEPEQPSESPEVVYGPQPDVPPWKWVADPVHGFGWNPFPVE